MTTSTTDEWRLEIASLPQTASNEVRDATWALLAPLHADTPPHVIDRDLVYGPHDRHRLDFHHGGSGATGLPLFLYVHGGGFVAGNKAIPGTPFYDNVGGFAVTNGWLGATITYRLAPETRHPAGAEDVATAVRFALDHAIEFGGRDDAIVVMGHSAGAALVASFAADPALREIAGPALRGVVLSSGIYRPVLLPGAPNPYYEGVLGNTDAMAGLGSSDVPVLALVADHDPPELQAQSALLAEVLLEARGALPELHVARGHNHFSTTAELGAHPTWFGERIRAFVDDVTS